MASKAASSQPGSIATEILFLLRYVQQTAIILTGFIAAYFVYWHNALRDPVPSQLIELLTACAIIYLENFASSALALVRRDTIPNHNSLLVRSLVFSLALGIEFDRLRALSDLKNWDQVDDWFRPTRESEGYELKPAGVEQHHQALVCVLMITLLVAFAATLGMFSFAFVRVVTRNIQRQTKQGYAMVGEELDEDDDDNETICGLEDVEKR